MTNALVVDRFVVVVWVTVVNIAQARTTAAVAGSTEAEIVSADLAGEMELAVRLVALAKLYRVEA